MTVTSYAPSATERIIEQLARRFDPAGAGEFSQYQDDWVRCIEVGLGATLTDDIKRVVRSVQNNQITVVRSANGVGKTHCGAHLAIAFYKMYDGAQVYTCAAPPESNLKNLLWGEIASITEMKPELFEDDIVKTMHINRKKARKTFVTGVTIPTAGSEKQRESRFSGKHAPYLLFMVDEGDAVPDEVYRGIESCISGGFARLVVFFNPRDKVGRAWDMEHEGVSNVVEISAFNHPNVISGRTLIPGAVTREKTVERINLWTRPIAEGEEPKEEEKITIPDFLVGETAPTPSGNGIFPPLPPGDRIIIESSFYYMVLAQYPPIGESRLIPQDLIDKAVARMKQYVAEHGDIPPIAPAIMGLDVADVGQDSTSTCIRWDYFPRFFTWSGVEPTTSAEKAADLYGQYNCVHANVDALGVGAGVPERMRQLGCKSVNGVRVSERSTRYNPMGVFNTLRDQLWFGLREWLRTSPHAMLPENRVLLKQLAAPTYQVKGGRIMVSSKDEMRKRLGGASPDLAESLMLTLGYSKSQFDSI